MLVSFSFTNAILYFFTHIKRQKIIRNIDRYIYQSNYAEIDWQKIFEPKALCAKSNLENHPRTMVPGRTRYRSQNIGFSLDAEQAEQSKNQRFLVVDQLG